MYNSKPYHTMTEDATKGDDRVISSYTVIGLPKGTVLWPSAVSAIIFGILGLIFKSAQSTFGGIWLTIFAINAVILFFDFDRGIVLGLLGISIGIISLAISFDVSLPAFDVVKEGIFGASPAFMILLGVLILINLIIAYFMNRWFNYFVLTSNELVKKEGLLGDSRRYSTGELTVSKDINDVLESLLMFGTGTLTFRAKNEIFIIENVPRINRAEKEITKILTTIEVDTN